jgi:hypothetical protein
MPKTLEEIAQIAETQGLAYALTDGGYIKPEDFEDPKLREAAEQAREGLRKIDNALLDAGLI